MRIPDKTVHLANAVTVVGLQPAVTVTAAHPYRTFQLTATGDAVVKIKVSNTKDNFDDYIQLSCTSTTVDSFADICTWPFIAVEIVSNTDSVTVTVGY